jgi:hypothetical protein
MELLDSVENHALSSDCRRLIELEAEIFDHAVRVGGFLTRSRQVTIDEDRIGRIETQRLKRAQIDLSSPRHANLFAWIDEPEQAKRLQTPLRSELSRGFKRRLGNGVQKVYRD